MTGAVGAAADAADERFWLEFQVVGGAWEHGSLSSCGGVRFEGALPVRPFRFEKRLRSFAGWWYFATTGAHVGFESWLEGDHLMLMDFDPAVRAVSAQPFWLRWCDREGRARRHAPDFFARLADGTGVVVDVRPDDRIPVRDAETFALTASACQAVGWEYRRLGNLDPVLAANVRWLSRYRHRRCLVPGIAGVLLAAFAGGRALFEGAELAGDRLRVLPVLFHLMWQRQLVADLAAGPLGMTTVVHAGGPR
ncbi:TnsA-like heteromeric transposase endonuclease subunit [Dactylosporangium sp. CA-092794]|uniref:TnsA-like heteromeric transposase endonuclease subunit n=1 Tax=Dactylosporangium sp. CA-092794 TaxID=3239929 RepID=UPI003D8B4059